MDLEETRRIKPNFASQQGAQSLDFLQKTSHLKTNRMCDWNEGSCMAIELVVFDMAGTTVFDGDAVNVALRHALENAGVATSRDEVNAVMGIAKPVAIRSLLQGKHPSATPPDEVMVMRVYEDFLKIALDYYCNDPSVQEVQGASDLFRYLKSEGIKVTLDTGFSREVADAIIARMGWLEENLLDATVTSDEVELGRPHPEMIFRLMSMTGVRHASNVAKVGDTPSDLHQGSAAGCALVVGVTKGSHTREELLSHPHTHLIGAISELMPLLK